MQAWSFLLLRISLGLLMVIWGVDKVVNPSHSQAVIKINYFGAIIDNGMLMAAGSTQILLGLLIVIGLLRQFTLPLLILLTTVTLVAVFPSVVDPWGFVLKKTNVLFYPSLIIFAAANVLYFSRSADRLALDNSRWRIL